MSEKIRRGFSDLGSCECCDHGCVCGGLCEHPAVTTLYRIDMDDVDGTRMCEECSEDAMGSGVFSDAAVL